jgi:hypothetical protein
LKDAFHYIQKQKKVTEATSKYLLNNRSLPIEAGEFFVDPHGGERKECRDQRENEIFIIPPENFLGRPHHQQVKCEKKPVDIPHDDDVYGRHESFPVISDPYHCGEKQKPRNCFRYTNFLKPADDLLIVVLGEKII